jgi:hypothetical protein
MKDASRDEVIQWCIDNKVDFTKPLFPPPEGWAWGDTGVPAKLLTALCPSDEMEDIESVDIIFSLASQISRLVETQSPVYKL